MSAVTAVAPAPARPPYLRVLAGSVAAWLGLVASRAGDAVVVSVHNVGFTGATVVGLDPPTPPHHLPGPPVEIPARGFGTLVLPYGCGSEYVATVRYRLLDHTFSAPLAVRVPNGNPC